MTLTPEQKRLEDIKAKWESLKSAPANSTPAGYATAVALWASMNVDYLIARAEVAAYREPKP